MTKKRRSNRRRSRMRGKRRTKVSEWEQWRRDQPARQRWMQISQWLPSTSLRLALDPTSGLTSLPRTQRQRSNSSKSQRRSPESMFSWWRSCREKGKIKWEQWDPKGWGNGPFRGRQSCWVASGKYSMSNKCTLCTSLPPQMLPALKY